MPSATSSETSSRAYQDAGTTVFGGDVNRQEPCAPATMWARQDTAATQAAGVQHIYGSLSLEPPEPEVRWRRTPTTTSSMQAEAGFGVLMLAPFVQALLSR